MAKKRRKKAAAKGKVAVSRSVYNRLVTLGAAHHSTLAQLKRTATSVRPKKKARKKATKRRAKRRTKR